MSTTLLNSEGDSSYQQMFNKLLDHKLLWLVASLQAFKAIRSIYVRNPSLKPHFVSQFEEKILCGEPEFKL